MEVGATDIYTSDGTRDFYKNPANKEETGKWKACRYILSEFHIFALEYINCNLLVFS